MKKFKNAKVLSMEPNWLLEVKEIATWVEKNKWEKISQQCARHGSYSGLKEKAVKKVGSCKNTWWDDWRSWMW